MPTSIARCALRCAAFALALTFTLAADAGARAEEATSTRLVWSRATVGTPTEVTGTSAGTRHPEAHRTVQAVADRLDALRTIAPHVIWSEIIWEDGRVAVEAQATHAVWGNVAILAVRDLLPGRRTAGSGVQQIRVYGRAPTWRVAIRVAPPG